MNRQTASWLIGIAMLLQACGDGGGEPANELDGSRKTDPDFVTTLVLKDANGEIANAFSPGERITFELAVTNLRDSSFTITRGSTQVVDFFVAPSGTREIVWQWSHDKGFLDVVQTDSFAAHETKTYHEFWLQDTNEGFAIPGGDYVARGIYVGGTPSGERLTPGGLFTHHEFGSELIPFTIR